MIAYHSDEDSPHTDVAWFLWYAADSVHVLGQLLSIDYSDSTPDVAISYDRLGRQLTVTDVLGTRTNVYDALNLLEERHPDGTARVRAYDPFGRPAGIALGPDYAATYAYDEYGRFTTLAVSNGATFTYSYVPDSSLLSGYTNDLGLSVSYEYEPFRDHKTLVSNTWGTNPISTFAYDYDAVGRRTQRVDSGLTTNVFAYNTRSELINAVMGTNTYSYAYDPIGNRTSASENGLTTTYAANELNQYTTLNPGATNSTPFTYDADGNMTSDGTWSYTWDAENRLIEVQPLVTNIDSTLLQFMYDAPSRRIARREFAWNDYLGETTWHYVQGRAYLYDGWNLLQERKPATVPRTPHPYISQTNLALTGIGGPVAAFYLWGLDLSSTLQGAGGVGGLLAILPPASCLLTSACDSNGNTTDLMDTNGAVVAQYDYDPYGSTIVKFGEKADINPLRYSSKYRDEESGFYYYGYRFYNPGQGRWLSRDPIEEGGGVNLFVAVNNAPVDLFDAFGERAISFEINGRQSPLGISFFLRFSAVSTECPIEIEGGLFGAAEWQPPGLRYIQRPMDWFNIHLELGARGGIQGKINYSECFGLHETKVCGRIEAFGRAEYRHQGYHDPAGRFTRFRFGAGADGGCDLCLDLCSGAVSLDCALNYYAYLHFGFATFNRTYNYGGALSGSWQLGTFPQAAILKDYCNKVSDPNNCCCIEKYGIEKYGRSALAP